MVQSVSSDSIRGIVKLNPTSEGILKALQRRERHTSRLDLERYKRNLLNDGVKVVDEDYNNAWKEMEKLGLGSIVHGRGKKPDQFAWNYDLKKVGSVAFNEGNVSLTTLETKPTPSKRPKKRGRPKKKAGERKSKKFDRAAFMRKMWKKKGSKLGRKPGKVQASTPQTYEIKQNDSVKTVLIPIRNNLVQITIPSDLTKEESEVIASTVQKIVI